MPNLWILWFMSSRTFGLRELNEKCKGVREPYQWSSFVGSLEWLNSILRTGSNFPMCDWSHMAPKWPFPKHQQCLSRDSRWWNSGLTCELTRSIDSLGMNTSVSLKASLVSSFITRLYCSVKILQRGTKKAFKLKLIFKGVVESVR